MLASHCSVSVGQRCNAGAACFITSFQQFAIASQVPCCPRDIARTQVSALVVIAHRSCDHLHVKADFMPATSKLVLCSCRWPAVHVLRCPFSLEQCIWSCCLSTTGYAWFVLCLPACSPIFFALKACGRACGMLPHGWLASATPSLMSCAILQLPFEAALLAMD